MSLPRLTLLIALFAALQLAAAQAAPSEPPPLSAEGAAAIARGEAYMAEALATYPAQFPDRPLWRSAFAEGQLARELDPERLEPLRFLAEAYSRSQWTGPAWRTWLEFAEGGGRFDLEARQWVTFVATELGFGAYSRGDLELALSFYQQLARWVPDEREAHVWSGRILLELERPSEAAEAWNNALELDPADARSRFFADLAREQSLWGVAAVNAFREGIALYEQGRLTLAGESFERAASLNPRYAVAWAWLGRVGFEQERYLLARRAYANAAGLEPNNETYRYFLNESIARAER